MLFTQWPFPAFFLIVFGVHWLLPRPGWRKSWLLLSSYVFYAAWDWRFLFLIWGSTAVDYVAALRMQRARERAERDRLEDNVSQPAGRGWLCISLAANLGMLGFFKYCNFFLESLVQLASWGGAALPLRSLQIVLPVGISFFTFQTMSYTIDVYRGRLEPTGNLRDFALFVAFFPQLVAGPIVRAAEFLPQLSQRVLLRDVDFRWCCLLFVSGLIKKSCLADHIATLIDPVFAEPALWNAAAIRIATGLYAAQIYCDFSGYSDMAIACGGLLGYRLPLNFNAPYLARSVSEFWRRWHISLSTWLKDYLYIPLGGNRGTRLQTHRNLMITMLLGGLWHGAGWNFVVWGALHGVALSAHRLCRQRWSRGLPAGLDAALTLWWLGMTWVFFRAESWPAAIQLWQAYALGSSSGTQMLPAWYAGVLVVLWLAQLVCYWVDLPRCAHRAPDWLLATVLGALAAVALSFAQVDQQPFIYFQF